jgi:hypothetical protein
MGLAVGRAVGAEGIGAVGVGLRKAGSEQARLMAINRMGSQRDRFARNIEFLFA